MEHIFGTLATDDLKLVHHRAARRGLQHLDDIAPRDPLPDQPVTILAQIGMDLAAEHVACYYTLDGSEPSGRRGVAINGRAMRLEPVDALWDTLTWGYQQRWLGTLPSQPEGTMVRYRIGAWAGNSPEVLADWPEVKTTSEHAAVFFFRGQPLPSDIRPGDPAHGTIFAYHVDHLAPPAWAREAVIYQVFVDRFYPGDGRDWLQTSDLRGICGGTLWGVCDRLDYIADLGATCLWLTPIFVSDSHHGYDASDYFHVEPRLGGDEALRALVEAARGRGLRILLDLACNHLSSDHPIFQSALHEPDSPYHNWFKFDDSELGYRAFFGVPSMPELDLTHPEARRWMIDIALYWLREFDVDGYRLDYANGPGTAFWPEFWTACKAIKPDCCCFGEIVDAPDVQRAYIGRLDGFLDFHLGDALRRTFGRGEWTESDLERFVERHRAYFHDDCLMPNFLDNHDMDRLLFVSKGDKQTLMRAAAFQMNLPNPPIIYYGTEVGLSQTHSVTEGFGAEMSRAPMLWGDAQDADLLAYYRTLIHRRRGP
jgi:hypothetical protein